MRLALPAPVLVWVAGLLTLVPFAVHRLLFVAPREEYALLIVGVLFWVFGYWAVVGPVLVALKVRRVLKALERARTREELMAALNSTEARAAIVDFVATEHKVPRLVAERVVNALAARLAGPTKEAR